MTNQQIRVEVIAAVTELQELSGRSANGIDAQTRPIGELPGFDSLNGVELAISISSRLGVEVDEKIILSPDQGKSPSIAVITDRIMNSCYSERAQK